jgi:replication-associated recombination protein RarA
MPKFKLLSAELAFVDGIKQIPRKHLKRLLKHLEDGKPVLLDGSVTENGVY